MQKVQKKQRVQKLLSNYGYCSRRQAEKLIEEGRVKVNGKLITLGDQASDKDKITVDEEKVQEERKVYLLFNKPIGCVTALNDNYRKTVMDYIHVKERVFPVGRLDYNTSGLLILTNDGDFANKVAHPRHETKKTYQVEVFEPLNKRQIEELEKGVELEDGMTRPAKVKQVHLKVFTIEIHEGKNKIVRRMFSAIGSKVRKLERIKIGQLNLGKLRSGKFCFLNEKDLERVFK